MILWRKYPCKSSVITLSSDIRTKKTNFLLMKHKITDLQLEHFVFLLSSPSVLSSFFVLASYFSYKYFVCMKNCQKKLWKLIYSYHICILFFFTSKKSSRMKYLLISHLRNRIVSEMEKLFLKQESMFLCPLKSWLQKLSYSQRETTSAQVTCTTFRRRMSNCKKDLI